MELLNQGCTGYVTVKKLDSNGQILEIREFKNLIVNQGLNLLPLLIANKTTPSTQIKIGLSEIAASVTQTDLLMFYKSDSSPIVSSTSNVLNVLSMIVITETKSIREFGLYFTNVMYSRVAINPGVIVNNGNVLNVTWSLIFSRV